MTNLINERFKEIRKEMGVTQTKYAELLGIKRSSVGAYEENRAQPPLEVIAKMMEIGEIPAEDMYDMIFDKNYSLPQIV